MSSIMWNSFTSLLLSNLPFVSSGIFNSWSSKRLHLIISMGQSYVGNSFLKLHTSFRIVKQERRKRMSSPLEILHYEYCVKLRALYAGQTKYRPVDLDTVSLKMYWNNLKLFGGESAWRRLLHVLKDVADKHQTTVACVAIQWVMSQEGGGIAFPIIGAMFILLHPFVRNLTTSPRIKCKIYCVSPSYGHDWFRRYATGNSQNLNGVVVLVHVSSDIPSWTS